MKKFFEHTLATLLVMAAMALGQIPMTVNYQGILRDAGGTLINGNQNLTFRIYTAATGGAALWTETQNNVPVRRGIFNVVLGSVTALALPFDRPYWLGITVGTGTELNPRTPLTASPYAFNSKSVVDDAVTSAKIANNTIVNDDVNNSAAISGTKIFPNFGAQNLVTTGSFVGGPGMFLGGPPLGSFQWHIFYANNGQYLGFKTTNNLAHRVAFTDAGNVGIGTTTPSERLTVDGVIQSLLGGFKFPDGTVQTTAATSSGVHVDIASAERLADAGDTDLAALVVAVNSSSGPVAGLTISNFTLSTETVPAGGCNVDLVAVQVRSTGAYMLDIVPLRSNLSCRWLRGRYLVSVLVTTPQGRAVGVAELLVDL